MIGMVPRMESKYQLDDLIRQNADWVVYRVMEKDGTPFALTRVRLKDEELEALVRDGKFEVALEELVKLDHQHVRPVIDGGVDKVDRYPWVVSHWFDGKSLSKRRISIQDIKNIGEQLETVVADLGQLADVLCFDAEEILTIRTEDGYLHVLFTVDYHAWFRDFALGRSPGAGQDTSVKVRVLLEGLVESQEKEEEEVVREKVREKRTIPMVEERSPALREYHPPRERYFGKVLVVLVLLSCLGAIVWLTMLGEEKAGEIEKIDAALEAKGVGEE